MTARDGLRAAIIGAGLMGRWHADAASRVGGRVTLIIDPDDSARAALGRRHPHAHLAAAPEATLVASHADVAHVCTPVATHASIVTALMEAGLHVLVEKPFTATLAEADAVLACAAARQRLVCPVHQFPFQDGVQRMVAAVPTLGVIRRLEFSACSAGAAGSGPDRLDELVADILPHPLSLAAAVLRVRVAELDWHVLHPSPGELHATAMAGSTLVNVAISASARPTENALRLVADEGMVTADLYHGYAVRWAPTTSRRGKITGPFAHAGATLGAASVNLARRMAAREPAYPGLRTLTRSFYAAVTSRGSAPISAESARDVVAARAQLLTAMESPG